ncbi:MAG: O-antigen ligase family protein [Bacteroidales bacterium]
MTAGIGVAAPRGWDALDTVGFVALAGFVAAVHFSIAAAETLLAVAFLAWLGAALVNRERLTAPPMFLPLAIYAAVTLVSVAFSLDPPSSVRASKQLLLFGVVPIVYGLARGARARTLLHVAITVGALSAILGVVQYGVLGYDNLAHRVQGSLGHWMTYSGLLLLVTAAATARLMFDRDDRIWPALIMPALIVAILVGFTRSAWVGTCAAVALLFALKDFRLVALVPVLIAAVLALVFTIAPSALVGRFYSVVNLKDPTSSDRISMIRAGSAIVRDHPLTGVGLDVIKRVYPEYRVSEAVQKDQPHLHNVPMQIAAERGLPALAAWLWFIGAAVAGALRTFRTGRDRALSAAALAAIVGMLAAGLFEYNFGDSEFLMLFLVLITLPLAAENTGTTRASGVS